MQWKVDKEKIIEANGLGVKYGATTAFADASFVVEKGDYVGLAGPNGAGKTTLVKALLGLVPVSGGSVKLFGEKMGAGFSQWQKIGYLPQTGATVNPLFPATVAEAVRIGLLAGKKFPRRLTANDRKIADQTLQSLGIYELRNKLVSELSGGQQQRVFLARALATNPQLLVLDEPSTGLDPAIREEFFDLLGKLNKEKKVTIVMITHDTGQIGHYAKKLLYLDKKIVFYGSFNDFCQSPDAGTKFGEFAQHLICHQHHPHHETEGPIRH